MWAILLILRDLSMMKIYEYKIAFLKSTTNYIYENIIEKTYAHRIAFWIKFLLRLQRLKCLLLTRCFRLVLL
jgi:hypothetical protein